jgi:hypothetical protein
MGVGFPFEMRMFWNYMVAMVAQFYQIPYNIFMVSEIGLNLLKFFLVLFVCLFVCFSTGA